MTHAAEIVRAAQTQALVQGQRLREPLGLLAERFLGYELTVRGRQYESVAAALNTALFDDAATRSIIVDVLGFTIHEVRAVREASATLMNDRFFGARDRVGDMAQSGAPLDDVNADAFRADINLMLSECRLFGAVSAADVAERAGMDESKVTRVLNFFSTTRQTSSQRNLVVAFAQGSQPAPWGCIADDGQFLILNGFLGEDELRRDIERGLATAAKNGGSATKSWTRYGRRRAAWSELQSASALTTLFNGVEPQWMGQKYLGPSAVEDVARFDRSAILAEVQSRHFESDMLYVVDDVAVCIEVKAGSVTSKARSGNAKRLATDLQKTLKEGNEQAHRLQRLIQVNQGVWNTDGNWIDLAGVREVHTIIVMLDDMGPLSLSMNELANRGIIQTDEVPWIVSLHDLVVFSRTLDHAAQFLEYLRRRRGRKLATMVNGVDELDMLMWFLNGGMYFEPDPRQVAAQIPIELPADPTRQRRFDEQAQVQLGTLTDPLDAWFYGTEGLSRDNAPKPTRREEPWIEEYLTASENAKSSGWLRFGADLVGLSGAAQRRIGKDLNALFQRARKGDRERSLTTHGTTSTGPWLLTIAAVPSGVTIDHLPRYMDAKQYQTMSSRSMLLLYRPGGSLNPDGVSGDLLV